MLAKSSAFIGYLSELKKVLSESCDGALEECDSLESDKDLDFQVGHNLTDTENKCIIIFTVAD